MSRPFKQNPTPRAPFNLRLTGPMKHDDIVKRLGKEFRTAHAHGDVRATIDADPCPHCGELVEWAPTSTTERGKTVQYIYARCQGKAKHSWGFSNMATKRDVLEVIDTTPAPRPSAGSMAMSEWIERKALYLEEQIKALQELKRLTAMVSGPTIYQSPQLPIPSNGDPTPPQRGR